MSSDTHPPRDTVINAIAAALFDDPARLRVALWHRINEPFTIAPHTHNKLIQFDLAVGCGGRALIHDTWTDLSDVSAMAVPAGVPHGYELEPATDNARVYHFRFKADADIAPHYPPLLTGLPTNEALAAAMRVVVRLGTVEDSRPPLLLARLVEVLSLWPNTDEADTHPPDDSPEDEARGLDAAVELIDHRIADPPSLDELAEVAHFSVRHFSRKFQAAFGCTPHTYLNARRLTIARQQLSQERLKVSQIAEQLGFGSVATFSRWFSQQAGMSPSQFREDPGVM